MFKKSIADDFAQYHSEQGLCTAIDSKGICWNKIEAKGLCPKHRARLKRLGSLSLPVKKQKKCKFIDCDKNFHAKGFCINHYQTNLIKSGNRYVNKRPCSVHECPKPFYLKGLCQKHHARLIRHGDVNYKAPIKGFKKGNQHAKKNIKTTHCLLKDCDKKGPFVKGICIMHYTRWIRHGDYNIVKK